MRQSNRAIRETPWLEPDSLEDAKSDLFFPLFNELTSLPQNELHWIRVLVGSATLERITTPSWDDIHMPDRPRPKGSNTTFSTNSQPTVSLGISFRFGFSQETIMLAIFSGLVNHITSVWIHRLIADFVGPSRFPVPSPCISTHGTTGGGYRKDPPR